MALAFASAFLAATFWGPGVAAVVGLVATVGWWNIGVRAGWLATEDAMGASLWALAGSLLLRRRW